MYTILHYLDANGKDHFQDWQPSSAASLGWSPAWLAIVIRYAAGYRSSESTLVLVTGSNLHLLARQSSC
jgi:hypothetical protein